MSKAPSSSQECNHCNRRVAVETLDDLVICCECNNVILPAGDSLPPSPPPSPPLSPEQDDYFDFFYNFLGVPHDDSLPNYIFELAIEALETFEVVSSSSDVSAVCIDAMVIGEVCKKLPCGHCYHGNCILSWLREKISCPLCRSQL